MPFSGTSTEHTTEYWTNHFERFLRPLIEKTSQLQAIRSEPLRGDILRQIITQLIVCPIVVADLTDRNPNVFWELGVRQSFKHGTITVAEEGTEIPFDLGVKGTLFYYPKNHIKNATFITQFDKAIKDCLEHPDAADSHVLETISGRGTLYELVRREEASRRVQALKSECDWNRRVLDMVYGKIDELGKSFTANRFRCACVELLITTRYLDEDMEFYKAAETYFHHVFATNERLSGWLVDPKSTTTWLKEAKPEILKAIDNFRKKLDLVQEKMSA